MGTRRVLITDGAGFDREVNARGTPSLLEEARGPRPALATEGSP